MSQRGQIEEEEGAQEAQFNNNTSNDANEQYRHQTTTTSTFPINYHRQMSIDLTSSGKMNKNIIICSVCCALLINLLHLASLAEAGRLQQFFQNLVGNSVGLSSVLSSALLASSQSSSSNNNDNNNDQQQLTNHRNSFISPSPYRVPATSQSGDQNTLISQRTSVSAAAAAPIQFIAQNNALENVSFDLDTAANNQIPSQVINLGEESNNDNKFISQHEAAAHSIMSPMMPAISPYLRYPSF